MQPRFVGRLGVADVVSVLNAALGFVAAVGATIDPAIGARLVLLAAVADGLDGVLARAVGSTPVGEYIDSLADVASFCVAPAVVVFTVASRQWDLALAPPSPPLLLAVALAVPALYVGAGVVRLGMYTAYDIGTGHTEGVQTTLAATLLAAAHLAGVGEVGFLLGATAAFTYLMVTRVRYPDLRARDALGMGAVQAGAIIAPAALGRAFPRALLAAALGYLLLGPLFYRRGA